MAYEPQSEGDNITHTKFNEVTTALGAVSGVGFRPRSAYDFLFWKEDSVYYRRDGKTGEVTDSTNASTLVNASFSELPEIDGIPGYYTGRLGFAPHGFNFDTKLTVPNGYITFKGLGGHGFRSTLFCNKTTADALISATGTSYNGYLRIEDISFTVGSPNTFDYHIYLENQDFIIIKNSVMYGSNDAAQDQTGIYMEDCFFADIQNIHMQQLKHGIQLIRNAKASHANNLTNIVFADFVNNGTGLYMEDSGILNARALMFEGFQGDYGIHMKGVAADSNSPFIFNGVNVVDTPYPAEAAIKLEGTASYPISNVNFVQTALCSQKYGVDATYAKHVTFINPYFAANSTASMNLGTGCTNFRLENPKILDSTFLTAGSDVDVVAKSLIVPFVDGTEASDKGWLVNAVAEYARAYLHIPDYVTKVLQFKVWAVAEVLEADAMRLEVVMNGGGDNEAYNTEAISIADKASSTTNFVADDIICWILTSTDDSDIADLAAGDSLDIKILHEAAGNGDLDTQAFFRAIELQYV